MALVVEDGTGLAAADSYVGLADYTSYATLRGWAVDAAKDEIRLRRAFDALNRNYSYAGAVLRSDQAGAFPRRAVGVPRAIKHAQCELAQLIAEGLDPFKTVEQVKTSERVKVGPIEEAVTMQAMAEPRLTAVEGLLRPYLATGAGQTRMVRG